MNIDIIKLKSYKEFINNIVCGKYLTTHRAPMMYRLAYGSYKAVGWVQLPVGAAYMVTK